MGLTKSAVKAPIKKLLAVATVASAATGTVVALSSKPPATTPIQAAEVRFLTSGCWGTAPGGIHTLRPAALAPPPVEPPIQRVIKPLELRSGWPACGNLVDKAGFTHRRPCPAVQEQTVGVAVDSSFTGLR